METKRLTRSFLKIAMTAFLLLLTGHAFAIDNKTRVVSPYWQVDTGSYSFIAVSHSSLSGMASQIGLTVTAIDNSGTSYGTAQDFTITQGGYAAGIHCARSPHYHQSYIPNGFRYNFYSRYLNLYTWSSQNRSESFASRV